MDKDFSIRRARRADCPAIMELIRELAVYERAPEEVTADLAHFEESGFGERPVWWAFVACTADALEAEAAIAETASQPAISVQDPMLASLIQEAQPSPGAPLTEAMPQMAQQAVVSGQPTEPGIQLEEAVTPSIPEQVMEALPLMQPVQDCQTIIGFALYYIRYSTWKGQRMYLEDLLVTESWRGKGVGTALMDALIGAARAEGLHGISLQVLEWNEPAIRFYGRYNARLDEAWTNAAIDV